MKYDYTIYEGKGRDEEVQSFFHELVKGSIGIVKMEILMSPSGLNCYFGCNHNTWAMLCEQLGEEKLKAWRKRAAEYFKTVEFARILRELADILTGLPDEAEAGEGYGKEDS